MHCYTDGRAVNNHSLVQPMSPTVSGLSEMSAQLDVVAHQQAENASSSVRRATRHALVLISLLCATP